jgi:serine/threonine protein kinase
VQFHQYQEDHAHLYFVMELAPGGDLLRYMEARPSSLAQRLRLTRACLRQLVQAVQYLQDRNIAHRDIKPENILVCAKRYDGPLVQLCDFGWAVSYSPDQRRTTLCGTPEYVPPEMLQEPVAYDPHYIDRWAMGVLAYELVHGQAPFTCAMADKKQRVHAIFDQVREYPGMEPRAHSRGEGYAYAHLVSRWMRVDPTMRWSMERASQHEFIRTGETSQQELSDQYEI